ncbi:C-X-C chemokine receptor type 3-like [Puntigrus tetrazona]|uniref:C-X-C chemokine receptor type 3-like n=1 Tax=Puntigrus tetrazona TaxID=1606681 RepID=UPI001C8AD46F|nr:C-X-C chemokine receptor type 3-like [Puntigrus tetrazona]
MLASILVSLSYHHHHSNPMRDLQNNSFYRMCFHSQKRSESVAVQKILCFTFNFWNERSESIKECEIYVKSSNEKVHRERIELQFEVEIFHLTLGFWKSCLVRLRDQELERHTFKTSCFVELSKKQVKLTEDCSLQPPSILLNSKMNATDTTFEMDDLDFFGYNYSYSEGYDESCCEERIVCDQESSMRFDSIFIPVVYSVALVVGLVGNGLLLVILWKKRRRMNATNIFILHLCLADILLLLTLPFWAVEVVSEWIFGTVLCKMTGALFKINFYCGIFMLSCISLDRYLSIVHAVQMYSRKKPMGTHCCCLMVWLFCLLLSIPDWIFLDIYKDFRHQDKTQCVSHYPSDSWRLSSRLLYHLLGFILPALVMLFCYSSILLRLQRGSQCKQKKRAIRVIIALVVAFFIHWTPFNITLMVDTIQTNQNLNFSNQTSCESFTALHVALTVTSTVGYLHTCVIPLLFLGLVSQKSFLWS